jgi:hypothetical protein
MRLAAQEVEINFTRQLHEKEKELMGYQYQIELLKQSQNQDRQAQLAGIESQNHFHQN